MSLPDFSKCVGVVILPSVVAPDATSAGLALGGNAAFQQIPAGTLIIQPSTVLATPPFLGFPLAQGAVALPTDPANIGTPKQLAVIPVTSIAAVV